MERRQFSGGMKGKNLRYLNETSQPASVTRVGFLLLEHFSLPAFTQALDTLVTANLIQAASFTTTTFSLDGASVVSDLGLVICPDATLEGRQLEGLDLLVVAGKDGLTPGHMAETLEVAPTALSFHLKELSHAGLVHSERDGRHLIYRASIAAMNELLAFLTAECCQGQPCLTLPVPACAPACSDC